ncbi:MAG TPA: hypothetical protein DD808_14680 [Halieaceae bacterium]|jgi:hypothetical protein|uniref:YecA family protein n=1 Tax=Haliea salexigens TaxID=287487 RepID=A0A3C1KQW9_9GAMM|nr:MULTISPECIES: UPF0149 family protein [Haliea]MCR9185539.1 UPF0149 family protein [Halieaceae bacterium]HAN28888.1 hypothetical protein [Haliea salexigens]MAY92489.1 hypothetical protein [Haliea sp.]MBK40883.1 hypothetical protein [Haliea sp.]MBP68542.1 hypothetical protein [Haliea sp.]|tara:strand:+ start:13085 stop:13696 length:612 start_codon:yes stop_codon:yes gene_type:complete
MFDRLPGDTGLFDFDDVADQLLEQGVSLSPAEVHGCLVGLLAAGHDPEPGAGLNALNQALDLDLHGALADEVMQLYAHCNAALVDDVFDFSPLLPDESHELAVRTASLADWCRGFLTGFARTVAASGTGGETLPGDSTEILRDFAAMAQASADEHDEDDDEAEEAYFALVEYLRVAAVNVFLDTRGRQDDRERSLKGKPDALH